MREPRRDSRARSVPGRRAASTPRNAAMLRAPRWYTVRSSAGPKHVGPSQHAPPPMRNIITARLPGRARIPNPAVDPLPQRVPSTGTHAQPSPAPPSSPSDRASRAASVDASRGASPATPSVSDASSTVSPRPGASVRASSVARSSRTSGAAPASASSLSSACSASVSGGASGAATNAPPRQDRRPAARPSRRAGGVHGDDRGRCELPASGREVAVSFTVRGRGRRVVARARAPPRGRRPPAGGSRSADGDQGVPSLGSQRQPSVWSGWSW